VIRHQLKAIITEDLPKAVVVGAIVGVAVYLAVNVRVKGAEPRFTVVNRTTPAPRFEVVNRTQPPVCPCKSAPGGVGTCGTYVCPANGGSGPCPCGESPLIGTTPAPGPDRLDIGGVPHVRGADNIYRPVAASGVAVPARPFQPYPPGPTFSPAGSGAGTIVRPVGGLSTSFPGATRTAPIAIGAPWTAPFGATGSYPNCTRYG
jgi:hypothetical protein